MLAYARRVIGHRNQDVPLSQRIEPVECMQRVQPSEW
jgi:hypothetical protein